jgi:lipoprotein-anchoring transpeptidase ErfK/SrfK
MFRSLFKTLPALLLVAGAACSTTSDKPADTATAAAASATPAPSLGTPPANPTPTPDPNGMRLEVDIAARKLYVYKGTERVETHPVAVGSKEWPTQTGEWTVKQVIFNPEWIPPDESWAEEREPRKPGDPKNPLGRAQLVYDVPRSIHGTNAPSSIGKPVSHGSIRMANEEIVALAREVLAAGGAPKDDAWIQAAQTNRSEKQIVDLPQPIPIKVF